MCVHVCCVHTRTRLPGGGEGNSSNQSCQRAVPGDKSNMIDLLHQLCMCVNVCVCERGERERDVRMGGVVELMYDVMVIPSRLPPAHPFHHP